MLCIFKDLDYKIFIYNTQDYKTTRQRTKKKLEISGMHNIRGGILWSNNIKNLQHIIQNPIPLHSTVVVLIPTDKALDL